MKRMISITLAASILAVVGFATANAASGREASIRFADHGGIHDYKPVNDELLYVQSRDRSWYRVQLVGPCNGLNFALGIRFEPEPDGTFTRFSHVRVDGQRCPVHSVVAIPGKPPRNAN